MTIKWWLGMAGLAVGLATVAGTLLGFLGRTSWVFDLLGNFRFQYLWVGVLSIAAIAWNRWWRWIPMIGLGVLINLLAVGPYLWGSIAEPAAGDRLTIVHLNTQAGNRDKAAVVEFVRASDADLVLLAEVTPDLLDLIDGAALPFQPVSGTPPTTPIGLLALSRDPRYSGRVTNLGESRVPALLLEGSFAGSRVEILAFHTSSPGREARSSARDDQLAAAAALVIDRETPMILVGDFNSTPWTGAFRDLLDAGLVDAQRGRGVAGSWPAGWGPFKIPIDHLLHTPDLTTTSFAFGDSAGSDHRSLRVTLAVAAEERS
jgi:endonuclease/exonuclease/phosphatase (EEP) superfamily protein YafD